MAKIPLRAYNREIESLIESGQIDEAIAHCRYILQSFPKHVDTYRLLGKAFLEAQRYGDAADILQRVLSSVPEDFVSQVGMSIIREDEGNLDQAIWHMERAFEMQPANNAIQEELRRLYGRRDGFEPPKVRLTRGALARMYVKGDLYQQAIAELRAALAEDPQRIDLLVLLAQVYFQTGQRVDAAETSSAVLRKLPYSLEANRIMAEVLSGSERSEEANGYRQRLQALDPYLGLTSHSISEKAPDQAVLIEKLDWMPGMPGEPEWAASLGVNLGEFAPDQEALPGWLFSKDEEAAGKGAAVFELPGSTDLPLETRSYEATETQDVLDEEVSPPPLEAEEQIPDWMKSAGWSAATSSADESTEQPELEGQETPEPADELAESEIPDWLQAMAPGEVAAETGPETADEDLSWLEEVTTAGTESLAPWLDDLQTRQDRELISEEEAPADRPIDQTEIEELPDWLEDQAAETEPGEILEEGEIQEAELPEWLGEMNGVTEPEATTIEDIPDWLKRREVQPADEAEALPSEELPEWLMETQASPTTGESEGAPEAETGEAEADLPSWLQELGGEPLYEGDTRPVRVRPAEAPAEPAQAEMEAETTAEAETAETAAEETAETAPEAEAAPMAPLPDWLFEEEGEPSGEAAAVEEEAAETAPMAPLPDWLLETEAQPGEEVEPSEEAPAFAADETLAEETTLEQAPPEEKMGAMAFDVDDAEAGFAWLEGLAARQGAEEGMLFSPEERLETPPDWVQEAMEAEEQPDLEEPEALEAGQELVEPAAEVEQVPATPEAAVPELPEWLRDLAEAEEDAPPVSEAQTEAPEWVQEGTDEEEPEFEAEAGVAGAAAEGFGAEFEEEGIELPGWLAEETQELGEQEAEWTPPEFAPRPAPATTLDLNQASLAELEKIPGIGYVVAQQIVAHREYHGPFSDLEELQNIFGFSPSQMDTLKEYLRVEGSRQEKDLVQEETESEVELVAARNALVQGNLEEAIEEYTGLIKAYQFLPDIIRDLHEALYRYPVEVSIWQALGDAHLRNDQLQEALDAYIKAEELLR